MTKNEFARLQVFLKRHPVTREYYHCWLELQDGSRVTVEDCKSMDADGPNLCFRQKSGWLFLPWNTIKRVNMWACPRGPNGSYGGPAEYF